ncbi:MAG TPA: lysylphosphatidylglycerol synthase transmembrane domain-containing protein [Anaerolineaceae bacterium]
MRKFIAALVLLLAIVFLLTRFAELNQILAVLERGNLLYLGLALLVEAVWLTNLSAFYQSVYQVFGMLESRLHMFKLVSAAYFLTVVAPSAGLSAMAVYLADAQRRGRSTGKVTVAAVLYVWFEQIGTLSIVVVGLAELARRNHLHWAEITASLVLLAGALIIGLLLYLGIESTRQLSLTLAWAVRVINRALRPVLQHDYLQEARAYSFSAELAEGLAVMRDNPRWIIWPLLFSLVNKALLLIVLALCFLAFKVPLDASTLVCGLSIAQLFLIVSPTPAGIGIVEGILAVTLGGLGVRLDNATVVAIAYRFFSFWIPLLVGSITFRMLGQKIPAAVQLEPGHDPD